MKAVEYKGHVLLDGHLEIPTSVKHELHLHPNAQVKVILLSEEKTAEEQVAKEAERAQKRHEAWQGVMEFRKSFADMNFSLIDEIVKMREEEDV